MVLLELSLRTYQNALVEYKFAAMGLKPSFLY